MPDLEFEFNQKDRDLVVEQTGAIFNQSDSLDYIRLTIYPQESINNIVRLPNSTKGIDGKAIFFSSLSSQPFIVNVSQFEQDNTYQYKEIGGTDEINDFKIYKNGKPPVSTLL